MMDVKELKRLMDAMQAAGVAELELEWDGSEARPGGRVALRRASAVATGAHPVPGASVAHALAASPAAGELVAAAGHVPGAAPGAAAGEAAPAEPKSASAEVVAPIVGTFYATPSPDSPAYVRVGDRVKVGQVLCIIEAMKLMNEIEAEVAGTVVEILVRNEDPVEYGQVLMRIAPA